MTKTTKLQEERIKAFHRRIEDMSKEKAAFCLKALSLSTRIRLSDLHLTADLADSVGLK